MANGEAGEQKAASAVSEFRESAGGPVPPWFLPFPRPGLALHCPGAHEAPPWVAREQRPRPGTLLLPGVRRHVGRQFG